MTTLKLILSGIGLAGCVAWFIWLHIQPRKWDGCIYKSPGHHGRKFRLLMRQTATDRKNLRKD